MTYIEELASHIQAKYPVSVEIQGDMFRVIKDGYIILHIADDTWLVPKITLTYDKDKQEQIHYGNRHEHAEERIDNILADSIENGKVLCPVGMGDRLRWASNLAQVDEILNGFTKEFHLFLDLTDTKWDYDNDSTYYESNGNTMVLLHTLKYVRSALSESKDYIATTQVAVLSFSLLDKGYRIFVHSNGHILEMKPFMKYSGQKEIRIGHNLSKLLICGHFDADFEN